jgi:hypothetical protein
MLFRAIPRADEDPGPFLGRYQVLVGYPGAGFMVGDVGIVTLLMSGYLF